MNRNTQALIIGATLTLSSSLSLAQGYGAGNGGGVHYCPALNTAEFYDLYEARNRYGLEIRSTGNAIPENIVIEAALQKLEHENITFGHEVRAQMEYLNSVNPRHFLINNDVALKVIEDANILFVDEGCEYRQLANWDDVSNNIIVKGSIYRKMDRYNHAALKLHEAIYKASRLRNRAKNSDDVRRLVGELLSTLPSTTLSTKNLAYGGDIHNVSLSPQIILDGNQSQIHLGKISRAELKNLGRFELSIREIQANPQLPITLAIQMNDEKLGPDTLPIKASISTELKEQSEENLVQVVFGSTAPSPRELTLDFTFTKNDGSRITQSQIVHIQGDAHINSFDFKFRIFADLQ